MSVAKNSHASNGKEKKRNKRRKKATQLTDKFGAYIIVKKCYEDRKSRAIQYVTASELSDAKKTSKKWKHIGLGRVPILTKRGKMLKEVKW